MERAFSQRFACIVGAPRTGTTSLAHYLRSHPSVCFSRPKEPHFFSRRDLNSLEDEELRETVASDYLDRFFPNRLSDNDAILIEGSVTYLFAPERMRPILRLWPDAKFIIGLRDPVEMIPSLHQRLLVLGDETVRDFERAWRLVGERKAGRRVPRTCIEPQWLRYDQLGRLGSHVETFISVVGKDHCFFVLHDQLRANPSSVCLELVKFLGLSPHELADTSPRRAGRGFKIGWVQRLLMRPPLIARKLLAGSAHRRRFESLDRLQKDRPTLRVLERARKQILKWNEADSPRPDLSPALHDEFQMLFGEEISKLAKIVGRDLDHWL